MIEIIFRRFVQFLLLAFTLSFLLFIIFDTDRFRRQIAIAELGGLAVTAMTDDVYDSWLEEKGLTTPLWQRYPQWIGRVLQGDLGDSWEHKRPVAEVLSERVKATAILAGLLFALMIPLSLICGIVAGMKEHSLQDRTLSIFAIVTTSIPEIATAIFLSVIFSLGLGWLPSKSVMLDGFELKRIILPVLTLLVYDFGYIMRMTRASVIDVYNSPYIRSAILKGVSWPRLIVRHILRNALMTPLTIIILQLNWLLSGVVVVEVFFQYSGFGQMLLKAALFGDIYVLQAGTMIAVLVAVGSQLLSDIGYVLLNPRIRFNAL